MSALIAQGRTVDGYFNEEEQQKSAGFSTVEMSEQRPTGLKEVRLAMIWGNSISHGKSKTEYGKRHGEFSKLKGELYYCYTKSQERKGKS